VEALSRRHRAQLLHYLLLCDVGHGKLINVRPAAVQHEFVNSYLERADRNKFAVRSTYWNAHLPGVTELRDLLTAMLHDLGSDSGLLCTRRHSRISLAASRDLTERSTLLKSTHGGY
jgi:hypothetical protein